MGANIGLTAVYFGRLYPEAEIACIEPVPDNLRMLARNIELNATRATIIPAAVVVGDGPVKIELSARAYGHRIATAPEHAAGPMIDVAGISVPSILQRLAWDRIGLLKVDIEGHEGLLFADNCDWLARVDAMCIEWHDEFADANLERLATRFHFASPQRLPGTWFLQRLARPV